MVPSLIELDQKLIWHPYTQAKIAAPPIAISRAKGAYLFTDSGHKLFDGISSWWTTAHGHCHPHIAQAISRQADTLQHVMFANFTHEPAVKLAEILLGISPKGLSRVFYSDNGSTAVETALKMAYQYWHNQKQHRPYFIALEHGYHGDTFGAMSVSERSVFTKPFWPLLFNVLKSKAYLPSLAELFDSHQGQIAGVIIEPMLQAAGGMRIFPKGLLAGIKELCLKSDALLIADEVATGFYRTGTMFACEHEQVSPDILCLAKGLTGGSLPLAATLATDQIYGAFLSDNKADALLHGHTFTANPLGCAAAIASLEIFKRDETKKNISDIYTAIQSGIERFKPLPQVEDARSIGAVGIIELKSDEPGYTSRMAEKIYQACLRNGLFIRPLGHIVYLMPPLCSSSREIDWALDIIREGIEVS